MSGRPRKVTDDQLFAATQSMMSRLGPGELTLAAIAEEAGVTAAVLIQRFGSKRALLLALAEKHAADAGQFFSALAKQHASPLEALRSYAGCMADMAASPAALARALAYLEIDLTDSEFRKHLVRQARATRTGLLRIVKAAQAAGELAPTVKPSQLARTIESILTGSMINWAFYREGTATNWMQADLEAVLAPFLAKPRVAEDLSID